MISQNRIIVLVKRKLETLLDKIVLPGFDGLPLHKVIIFFLSHIKHGSLTIRASSIAFNTFLAIFPALIFFFSLIAYLPYENFHVELLKLLYNLMPHHAYQTIQSTIIDTISNKRTGLISLGFIMTLYFAVNGVNSMISAFNASQRVEDNRNWFDKRLVSVIILITETVLITSAISLIVFSQWFFNYLLEIELLHKNLTFYLIVFGKWVISIALLFFAISFLYYFAPIKKMRYRVVSAGSTLATAMVIATSLGFSFYVNNFANYNKIYGSLGTIIILLLWFYFISLVLLIGYELNISIKKLNNEICEKCENEKL